MNLDGGSRLNRMIALTCFTFLVSCSPDSRYGSSGLVDRTVKTLGCWNFKDEFYDGLYDIVQARRSWPSPDEFHERFDKVLSQSEDIVLDGASMSEVVVRLKTIYGLLTHVALENVPSGEFGTILEVLTAIELGDRTTEEKKALQIQLEFEFDRIEQLAENRNRNCATKPQAELSAFEDRASLAHFGVQKTFAVSYQSCNVLSLPPLDKSVPNVKGIKVTGKHPAGGNKRVISNLNDYLSTNPYLKSLGPASPQCLDVKKNPLIYDFGGKPAATTAIDSKLDLFRDAGTGTTALGVDCSGFVYSSLAASGLKVRKEGRLKAISVFGISATMMSKPKENGLTCLEPVQIIPNLSIRNGDILAQAGHVVMVTHIGADPFGIQGIQKLSDCKDSKIDTKRFDFSIYQSSPSKKGIGINLFRVKDYLSENSTMAKGLKAYAVAACKARFGVVQDVSTVVTFVRHQDVPECYDQKIALQNQECVSSCPAFEGVH